MANGVVEEPQETGLDLKSLYTIIRRRAWLVAATMAVVVSLVFVGLRMSGSYYRAYRSIRPSESILKPPGDVAKGLPFMNMRDERLERLGTLVQMASNPAVADGMMKLTFGDVYGDESPEPKNRNIMDSLGLTKDMLDRMLRGSALEATPVSVRVTPKSGGGGSSGMQNVVTDLIQFSAQRTNRDEALYLVDALTVAFKQFYETTSKQPLRQQVAFFESQVKEARSNMEMASARVKKLRQAKGVVDFNQAVGFSYNVLGPVKQQHEAALANLAGVEASLAVKKRQLAASSPTMPDEAGKTIATTALEKQLAELETTLASQRGRYADGHPTVMETLRSIEQVKQKLAESQQNLPKLTDQSFYALRSEVKQLEARRSELGSQIRSLAAQISTLEGKLASYQGVDTEIAMAQEDYTRAAQNYTDILTRYQAALLNLNATDREFIFTLGPARVEGPIKSGPSPQLALVGALFLSLLLGIGFAVGVDALDTAVRTSNDVERLLGLPVTGVIPRLEGGGPTDLSKITHLAPSSPYAEAYRFVGEDIMQTLRENPGIKSIMGATARPGQGGTTTMTNLAITLAQGGRRVILVDGDMRHPKLHKVFNVGNDIGLSSVLQREADLSDALQPTDVAGLALLPGGPIPRNAWLLLRSEYMGEIIRQLESLTDVVIVDTPSAAVFADASVFATYVDAVVVVVRANQPPRGNERNIRQMLERSHVLQLGVVLNGANPDSVESYHFNSHYYRYYRPEGEQSLSLGSGSGGRGKVVRRTSMRREVRSQVAEREADGQTSEDINERTVIRKEDLDNRQDN